MFKIIKSDVKPHSQSIQFSREISRVFSSFLRRKRSLPLLDLLSWIFINSVVGAVRCLHDRVIPHGVLAPPPPGASRWRDDVTVSRRLLGWRVRDDGVDGSVLSRDAVKLAAARNMTNAYSFVVLLLLSNRTGFGWTSGCLTRISLVSLPVVVGPRCVLTEASVLGSALHLATTKHIASLALSASINVCSLH